MPLKQLNAQTKRECCLHAFGCCDNIQCYYQTCIHYQTNDILLSFHFCSRARHSCWLIGVLTRPQFPESAPDGDSSLSLSLSLSLRLLRQHQPCKKNLSKVLYGIVVPQTHQNESPRCRLLHFYFLTQRYWTSNQARKFKHFMFSVFNIPSACCT